MARKQDEMSLDDELTAAFLSDSDMPALTEIEEDSVEEEIIPEDTPDVEPTAENELIDDEEDWDDTDDLPGQLAVDVYETAEKLIIKARTAGIERKDLDVSINDNILTISGVLNSGEDDKATQWHIQECYWGEFSRTIALPVQVKETGVEAILKDGVLTISFEKEKVAAPTRIQIN